MSGMRFGQNTQQASPGQRAGQSPLLGLLQNQLMNQYSSRTMASPQSPFQTMMGGGMQQAQQGMQQQPQQNMQARPMMGYQQPRMAMAPQSNPYQQMFSGMMNQGLYSMPQASNPFQTMQQPYNPRRAIPGPSMGVAPPPPEPVLTDEDVFNRLYDQRVRDDEYAREFGG